MISREPRPPSIHRHIDYGCFLSTAGLGAASYPGSVDAEQHHCVAEGKHIEHREEGDEVGVKGGAQRTAVEQADIGLAQSRRLGDEPASKRAHCCWDTTSSETPLRRRQLQVKPPGQAPVQTRPDCMDE
jgi:hypothetical protein